MKSSEQTAELVAALAKAQGEFPVIERGRTATVKTKAGGSYKYNYADLADVISAVTPALSKHGLSCSHECVVTREPLGVDTTFTLTHASGQYKEFAPLWLPCDDFMAPTQAIGSACTYGKRYTLQNGLGIATEEDDDGNAASGNDAETSRKEPLPACPKCGTNKSVIVGKPEYGGGFVCFAKKEGCGHKWQADESAKDETKPKGTATAKADAKKKADAEPELTEAEEKYCADNSMEIAKAETEAHLETIGAFLKDKSIAVQKKQAPLWLAKMKLINPNWKKKTEGAQAA